MADKFAKKGKKSMWQRAFSAAGFSGEKLAIKKPKKPQWQLDEERHARRAKFAKMNKGSKR